MTEVVNITDICPFCRKQQANLVCDFPTGTKWTTQPIGAGYRRDVVPCNNRMCEKCAVHISHEVDMCPTCIKKIRS